MAADSSVSCVMMFIDSVKQDIKCPDASNFSENVPFFKQSSYSFFQNLDYDIDYLQKLKHNVKLLYDASQESTRYEKEALVFLDQMAGISSTDEFYDQNTGPDLSAAWMKFCVIFKDLSMLNQNHFQSIKNNLLFPLETLLKSSELKVKNELKRRIEKAFKEYENRLAKCEKDHKNSSFGHLMMSKVDLAQNTISERTLLQYELCDFFERATKLQNKKGVELLQHLIDFYHTQEGFYREGLRTVEEFRVYVNDLINKLDVIKRNQDEGRRKLQELNEMLEKSPFLKDQEKSEKLHVRSKFSPHSKGAGPLCTNPSTSSLPRPISILSNDDDGPPSLTGYLYKQSVKKVHKRWLKRRCFAGRGVFLMYHSNEAQSPTKLNLISSQMRLNKGDKRCFDIITYDRTYKFQTDDQVLASSWLAVLFQNQEWAQRQAFHGKSIPSFNSSVQSLAEKELLTDMIKSILEKPGNENCADCGSNRDVTWMSINLGCLLCIDCSGVHRELGVQVSRIQSINLDYPEVATLLLPLAIGNRMFNYVYESTNRGEFSKLDFGIRNGARKSFIVSKYVDKKFVDKYVDCNNTLNFISKDSIEEGLKEILRLHACGIDLNRILDQQMMENALFTAIRHDNFGSQLPLIHFLIQNGVDVNRVNAHGDTCLHVAVTLNKPDVIKLLLMNGDIKLNMVNGSQETAKQLAHTLSLKTCHDIILQSETNPKEKFGFLSLPCTVLPRKSTKNDVNDQPVESCVSLQEITRNLSQKSQTSDLDSSLNKTDESSSTDTPNCSQLSGALRYLPPGAKLVLPSPPVRPPPPRITQSSIVSDSSADDKFIETKQTSQIEQLQIKCDSKKIDYLPPIVPPKPMPRQRLGSKIKFKKCHALYDCVGDGPDELSFNKGDLLIVTRESLIDGDDNWLQGYVHDDPSRTGIFPLTFVTFEK